MVCIRNESEERKEKYFIPEHFREPIEEQPEENIVVRPRNMLKHAI